MQDRGFVASNGSYICDCRIDQNKSRQIYIRTPPVILHNASCTVARHEQRNQPTVDELLCVPTCSIFRGRHTEQILIWYCNLS